MYLLNYIILKFFECRSQKSLLSVVMIPETHAAKGERQWSDVLILYVPI